MRRFAISLMLLAVGCREEEGEPRDQWVVTVSTDAPVPQFGDRLLVEIGDGACAGCTRLFDASVAARWPISFGVVAGGDPPLVSAKLVRSALFGSPELDLRALSLSAVVRLPVAAAVTRVGLQLTMGCFGVRATDSQSCDPDTGTLAPIATAANASPLVVGSWPAAQPVQCAGPAPPGMVCVPGGVFLLGDALITDPASHANETAPERLVKLSPYFIDVDELTVGEVRSIRASHPEISAPGAASASGPKHSEFCTYSEGGENDALPANCLDWLTATQLCQARGGALPSEAQWEYAAVNGTLETPYPWGSSGDDICSHAHVEFGPSSTPSGCRIVDGNTLDAGLVAGGSPGDVNLAGVRNLAGSVAEWTRDDASRYDDACWSAGLNVDPECDNGSANATMRGASFVDLGAQTHGVSRRSAARGDYAAVLGLRCVAQ